MPKKNNKPTTASSKPAPAPKSALPAAPLKSSALSTTQPKATAPSSTPPKSPIAPTASPATAKPKTQPKIAPTVLPEKPSVATEKTPTSLTQTVDTAGPAATTGSASSPKPKEKVKKKAPAITKDKAATSSPTDQLPKADAVKTKPTQLEIKPKPAQLTSHPNLAKKIKPALKKATKQKAPIIAKPSPAAPDTKPVQSVSEVITKQKTVGIKPISQAAEKQIKHKALAPKPALAKKETEKSFTKKYLVKLFAQLKTANAKRQEKKQANLNKIMAYAKERQKITNNDVEKLTGVKHVQAAKYLKILTKKRLLVRFGKTTNIFYKPVGK